MSESPTTAPDWLLRWLICFGIYATCCIGAAAGLAIYEGLTMLYAVVPMCMGCLGALVWLAVAEWRWTHGPA